MKKQRLQRPKTIVTSDNGNDNEKKTTNSLGKLDLAHSSNAKEVSILLILLFITFALIHYQCMNILVGTGRSQSHHPNKETTKRRKQIEKYSKH